MSYEKDVRHRTAAVDDLEVVGHEGQCQLGEGGEGTNVGHDHNLVEPAGEREDICILLRFYFFLNILCHCIARIEGKAQQTVLISDLICVICDKVC